MKKTKISILILMISISFFVINCSSDDKKDKESKTKKEDIKKTEMTKKENADENEGNKKPVRKMNPVQFAEIKIALENSKTKEEKEKKLEELLKKFDLTMSNYNDFKESLNSDPVAQTHVKSAYDALKLAGDEKTENISEDNIEEDDNTEKTKTPKKEHVKKPKPDKTPAKAVKKAAPKKRPAKPSVKKDTKKIKTPDESKKEVK